MKFKKSLLALPIVAVMGVGAISVFANSGDDTAILLDTGNVSATSHDYDIESEQVHNAFASIAGTITEIFRLPLDEQGNYSKTLVIQTEEERTLHLIMSENTVLIKNGELVSLDDIEEGQEIVAHYDNTQMVPAIYPARLQVSALVLDTNNSTNVHVDVFNKSEAFGGQLLSSDNTLRFEVTEDTVILDTNNEVYEGSLDNKQLVIIYSAASRSLPAIPLNPKIIVLGEAHNHSHALELFGTVSGTVAGIDKGERVTSVIIHSEETGFAHLNVVENTLFVIDGKLATLADIEEGQELTAHFEVLRPTIYIYPPRFIASALVVSSEENFSTVRVDVFTESDDFEGQIVSSDNSLRLEVTEDTVVVDVNNNAYEGSLENKKLAIIFSATTMSIPAIPLNPIVVVLGDAEDVAGFGMWHQEYYPESEYTEDGMINMVEFLPEHARGNSSNKYAIELL